MPGMHSSANTALQRLLPDAVLAVLHAIGAERLPAQGPRRGDAGGGQAAPRASWPGHSVGVRAPDVGETPLSAAEVAHGARIRLWRSAAQEQVADPLDDERDDWPTVQRRRPAGTWEVIRRGNVFKPNPFTGLMK
jgi:hypothetical protein